MQCYEYMFIDDADRANPWDCGWWILNRGSRMVLDILSFENSRK